MPNPYQSLGISDQASQDEIKNAYRKLAKKFHPDLNPGNKKAEEKFKDLSVAYEAIGTAEARAKYDRGELDQTEASAHAQEQERQRQYYYQSQQAGPKTGPGRYSRSFEGMDEGMFASFFGGGGQPLPRDDQYQMSVEFRESILGSEKEITLPNGKRLKVKIPPGIQSGQKLRFPKQGTQGGDAYVQVEVSANPKITRYGNDVESELEISISEALIGAEVVVPTLQGAVVMKIPGMVISGQRLRIPGKGVPGKGDHYIRLKIVNPPAKSGAMDDEFKAAVQAWSERHPFNPRHQENEGGSV